MKRTFTQSEITIERSHGGYNLSVITDTGNYYHMRYLWYTKRDAMKQFTDYVNEQELEFSRLDLYSRLTHPSRSPYTWSD